MNIDFRSHNLGEFDTTLRAMGLERNGKSGSAALPVALTGEADFHGSWEGSLISPRLSGNLKATQVAVELPPNPNDASGAPQIVSWDSIEANGSYDAERIAVLHGRLFTGSRRYRWMERFPSQARKGRARAGGTSCPASTPTPF